MVWLTGSLAHDGEAVVSDPGLRDCVYNVVHTELGDRTYPI
jgi:hypothetical protein